MIANQKTNDKQPDYVCSDPDCKFKWDKESRSYVKSDFRTGAWDPKPQREGDQGDRIIKGVELIYQDIQLIKKHLGI